jgi:hypothetical protein
MLERLFSVGADRDGGLATVADPHFRSRLSGCRFLCG